MITANIVENTNTNSNSQRKAFIDMPPVFARIDGLRRYSMPLSLSSEPAGARDATRRLSREGLEAVGYSLEQCGTLLHDAVTLHAARERQPPNRSQRRYQDPAMRRISSTGHRAEHRHR